MKKKLTIFILATMMCVTGIFGYHMDVQAEDIVDEDIEFSELLTEDALIGYAESQTRGVYLASGYSIINDAGGGKIGVGGITNAAYRCKVSVNAVVERLVSGSWVRVTSYSATNTNALTAGVSKSLWVSSGYYYRVRSVHYASTDMSSSCTSSLWM
ncbi:MAG: hypothetical protein IJZ53_10835 [Tyzzerella sp.]|nr:hypothetical protein [Tyzzerella sp.]